MSSVMRWRPPPRETPPVTEVGAELKHHLARRLWDHDGSLCADPVHLGAPVRNYLEGVRDAAPSGSLLELDAARLINAISEHGSAELWIDP